ncbi:N-acetylmuramoyl-L-alanine amidase [Tropicimonas sp. TH_r6]|uniref:N-acetylmuramoyl-L-alanine amidase n=1 Tax=Tropicimonas sp. TH_r6 TaxID=3082085 RepID=UPI0029559E72|nr:N-acetylmuramoyl-L-alanine amidase [Tropicimonas sp. TH_r6]MDV7142156.1 N-acetylmuramoyl-L-alanine amidase [Tropicimonas sp. TH_r6]
MIVLHYTAMKSAPAALERLCDPEIEVSAHYLIGRDGTCWQLVSETDRAWHAGAGSWGGRADVNSHSIGIELDNDGTSPFSEPLLSRLETLLADIQARHSIPASRVIGHSDMAPGRKIDPGRRFDWHRLARRGLACWPAACAGDEGGSVPEEPARLEQNFKQACERIGYPTDGSANPVLDAFRARFRQQASGPVSSADLVLARHLATRFPVDPGPGDA